MNGTYPLVDSFEDSYACSNRDALVIGSEQVLIDRCNNDISCTGYDYRKAGNSGYLCKQQQYPGSSTKCCGYKLCKKDGKYNTYSCKNRNLSGIRVYTSSMLCCFNVFYFCFSPFLCENVQNCCVLACYTLCANILTHINLSNTCPMATLGTPLPKNTFGCQRSRKYEFFIRVSFNYLLCVNMRLILLFRVKNSLLSTALSITN